MHFTNHRNLSLGHLLLVIVGCVWSLAAAAEEQRCLDLADDCVCSETFDTVPPDYTGTSTVNPTNSTTKECGSNGAVWYPGSAQVTVPEAGMPAGNSVANVWRLNISNGVAIVSGRNNLKSDTKRVCVREYLKFSPDYLNNGCNGGKFQEYSWDFNHSLQTGMNGYGTDSVFSCRWVWSLERRNFNCAASGPLRPSDCLGTWCRVEFCAEGDFAGSSGDFFLEGYWERISDGMRRDIQYQNIGPTSGSVGLNPEIMIGNNYRGADSAGCNQLPPTTEGYREVAYAMQAEWPFQQQGLFIGPAAEIETGGAAPPPDPIPDPVPDPSPSPGGLDLQTSASTSSTMATVDAAVSGGTGPYQFLFDCAVDGSWDGVIDTSQPSAQYSCPFGSATTLDVRVWAWDRTTSATAETTLQIDAPPAVPAALGAPGQPVLVQ